MEDLSKILYWSNEKFLFPLFYRLIDELNFNNTLSHLFNHIKFEIEYCNRSMILYPQGQGKRSFTSTMSSHTEPGELGSYDNLISWKSNLYIRSILRS